MYIYADNAATTAVSAAALEQAEIARNLYALAGAQPAFRHVIGQEGHRFYAREGWAAFDEVTGWNG